MVQDSFDPNNQDDFLAAYLAGRKPLSTNIAGIQRGGATSPYGGFNPDDNDFPGPDPAAFRIGPSSAAQPSALKSEPSAGAGKVLLGREAPSQPPPGTSDRQPPPGYAGGQAPQMVVRSQPPAAAVLPAPVVNPQTQSLLDQQDAIRKNTPHEIGETDAQGKPLRPQDIDPATRKLKTSAKAASWAQRLGMAVLASTKLAPYAQQIIHPEYTQQIAAQQGALKNIGEELKGQETAESTGALREQRLGQAQKNIEQGELAAAKSVAHYGQVQIDPSQAKSAFPLHIPEPDGSIWVDKSEAVEKEKELGKPLIIKQDEIVLDPITHKPVYTAPTKPEKIANEFEQWKHDHPNGTAEDFQKFQASGKAEPAAVAKQSYSKIMEKVVGEGLVQPSDLSNISKITSAINASKTLTQEEKNQAIAYQIANPTPAATATAGILRIEAGGEVRATPVINKSTGELQMVSATEAVGHPELYAPAGQGEKAMNKQAVFDDLHYNINAARNAIGALGSIDAGTRAALANQLQESDPKSAVSAFLHGAVGSALSPEQRHAVQALAQLSENALSMRSIAGMGQGSQDLRDAIRGVLPSAKSADKQYMQEQLNNFEQVVRRLEGGVPGMRNAVPSSRAGRTGQTEQGAGQIIVIAPDGTKHPFDTQAQADSFKALAGIK